MKFTAEEGVLMTSKYLEHLGIMMLLRKQAHHQVRLITETEILFKYNNHKREKMLINT